MNEAVEKNEIAFLSLRFIFFVALLLAGLDKFFYILTDWPKYLAPIIPSMFDMSAQSFMLIVGVIEIAVGIGVFFKTKIFSFVMSAWLIGIVINLFILGGYYDVALRDVGLAISGFALGQLAIARQHRPVDVSKRQIVTRGHPVHS